MELSVRGIETMENSLLERKCAALDEENKRLTLELIDARAELKRVTRHDERLSEELTSANATLKRYHDMHAAGYARNIRAQRVDNAERGRRAMVNVLSVAAGLAAGLLACFVAFVICL